MSNDNANEVKQEAGQPSVSNRLLADIVQKWFLESQQWTLAGERASRDDEFKIRARCYADVYRRCATELQSSLSANSDYATGRNIG